jgi:hypothetical protein
MSPEPIPAISDKAPSSTVKDCDDYGGIGIDEFSRRIQADNDKRYGDVIRNADWVPVGEPGW